MKLKKELNGLIDNFRVLPAGFIEDYAEALRAEGGYNDFEVRLARDLLRLVKGTNWICNLYEQYGCHDTHITTLARTALKATYTIEEV